MTEKDKAPAFLRGNDVEHEGAGTSSVDIVPEDELCVKSTQVSDLFKDDDWKWGTNWRITLWIPRDLLEACDDLGSRFGQSGSKAVVALVKYGLQRLVEEGAGSISQLTRLRLLRAGEQKRQQVLYELQQTAWQLRQIDDPARAAPLKEAARAVADEWGFPWPPPDATIVEVDPDARRLLDCVRRLEEEHISSTIKLREVYRELGWTSERALEVSQRLENEGLIELKQGTRQGSLVISTVKSVGSVG